MKRGCLTAAEIETLVSGSAAEETLPGLTEHLDHCDTCRSRLESAAGDAFWLQPLWSAEPSTAAPSTPALDALLEKLSPGDSGSAHGAEQTGVIAGILNSLDPSQRPGSLGRFGDYEILKAVDSGGMGIVLQALDVPLNRVVALKVLSPALVAHAASRERFLREARSVAAIRHENVVAIHAVAERDGLPFLVMEFVEGESLARRLQRDGPLPAGDIVQIGRQIADGLAAAHARGIIHRDVKPANILLEAATGRACLTDFGLARALEDPGLTHSGFVPGTPEYLSPEQVAGRKADARSDLFGLGCVLYAMAAGQSPFRAASTLSTIRSVCDSEPVPLSHLNPSLPPWLDRVIQRLLLKDPSQRLQSAEEVSRVLAGKERVIPRTEKAVRPRNWAGAAVAAVLFLLLVLVAYHRDWFQILKSPPPGAAPNPAQAAVAGSLSAAGPGFVTNGPIILWSIGRILRGSCATLADAVALAHSGDLVEIRHDGSFSPGLIQIQGKALRIRAAGGVEPIWVCEEAEEGALQTDAPLILEGIAFLLLGAEDEPAGKTPRSGRPPPRSPPSGATILRSEAAPLHVVNCRFRVGSKSAWRDRGTACIKLINSPECHLANCEFFPVEGKGVVVAASKDFSGTKLTVINSVFQVTEVFWFERGDGATNRLELERVTVQGRSVMHVGAGDGAARLEIEARRSVFASGSILSDAQFTSLEQLRERLTWVGEENLLQPGRQFVRQASGTRDLPPELPAWNAFWGQSVTGSRRCRLKFAGWENQDKTSVGSPQAEDYVLESVTVLEGPPLPESAPKDFGVNPAASGPGPAYNQWRASGAYARWLEQSRRVLTSNR